MSGEALAFLPRDAQATVVANPGKFPLDDDTLADLTMRQQGVAAPARQPQQSPGVARQTWQAQ